jgi:enoyl-[acyl-carrier protein] reductase I
MSYSLSGKTFLITGVSNRKSVAYHVATQIEELGGDLIFTVQSEEHASRVSKLFPNKKVFELNVLNDQNVKDFGLMLDGEGVKVDGMLHSIAFANYSEGVKPFHDTLWQDFNEAYHISTFSLMSLSGALKNVFNHDASVVTISISNTRVGAYGYMGPIKAGLDSTVSYLAKSFSEFSRVRINAVCAGPLKTSASAGIPGYIDNYLYSEKLTLRGENLKTQEVANTAVFLLGPLSSGINATGILVDAGMSANYFDQKVVKTTVNNWNDEL